MSLYTRPGGANCQGTVRKTHSLRVTPVPWQAFFPHQVTGPLKFSPFSAEYCIMKVSSGIAEIHLPRTNGPEKVYLWPRYGEERIEPTQKVSRRTESNIPYYKAPRAEEERILNLHREKSYTHYAPDGVEKAVKKSIAPGSLFEALV